MVTWYKACVRDPRLLGLWVRNPPGIWMSVSCECLCVETSLRRADPSSRAVLPRALACVCVCVAECDQVQQ